MGLATAATVAVTATALNASVAAAATHLDVASAAAAATAATAATTAADGLPLWLRSQGPGRGDAGVYKAVGTTELPPSWMWSRDNEEGPPP